MGIMHQVRGRQSGKTAEARTVAEKRQSEGKVVIECRPPVVGTGRKDDAPAETAAEKKSDGFAAFVNGLGVRGAALAIGISQGSVIRYCRDGAPRRVRLAVWALERGAEV